jgi:hypothetical protein
MSTNENEVLAEIEQEIEKTKAESGFEIEIVEEQQSKKEEPVEEKEPVEAKAEKPDKEEYGQRVQRRINKLVEQRREAEAEAEEFRNVNKSLEERLSRLEQGSENNARTQFEQRYNETKSALAKSIEEGDSAAQLQFTEQLADMRAAIKVAETTRHLQQQQPPPQMVEEQVPQSPPKAYVWHDRNQWFNSSGYERQSSSARAIDVQLEMEGYDKNDDSYYRELDTRLQKVHPELYSKNESPQKKVKSRNPVAPTAGGSPYKGNRVQITRDQLNMARELGITDENALKVYAQEIRSQNKNNRRS